MERKIHLKMSILHDDEGCSEYFFSDDYESSIDVFETYESEVDDDDIKILI